MLTYHIHIQGQVQGVGFRPYVYRMAKQFGLHGWVNNTIDGVHVEINCKDDVIDKFYSELVKNAPPLSKIIKHKLSAVPIKQFDRFDIIESGNKGRANLLLTPDFAICPDCRKELADPTNKRHHYPFITCTNCGPRYSITWKLPYDREHTTMENFAMCESCHQEYEDPENRRYYSQTNSCKACSIRMTLYKHFDKVIEGEQNEILKKVAKEVNGGKIIAVKGIGGYLLLADATNEHVIQTLRKRKQRPTKPFALMYPDLKSITKDADLRKIEKDTLTSSESPIVLLELKDERSTDVCTELIAPGLSHIGVMLPYAPLLQMIMNLVQKPLIATSGNISGSPIIYDDIHAREDLLNIADFVLTHDREIMTPQDDSVLNFSSKHKRKVIMRRSRGYAPTFIHNEFSGLKPVLAMGADMKSTFTLFHEGNTYVSQYLGDLEDFNSHESYRHTLHQLINLFQFKPERIMVDKHPLYHSNNYGFELADNYQVPLEAVQHHKAHFAAVLAENRLIDSEKTIMGVVWDGTGLGDDDHIWGGEFFQYENYTMDRLDPVSTFPHILGNKMSREPRISAFAICQSIENGEVVLRPKFSEQEWDLYQKMVRNASLTNSSMGRIFDGVASILGLIDYNSFEGEAAMLLESLASRYISNNDFDHSSYLREEHVISSDPLETILTGLLSDTINQQNKGYLAAKFHRSLVDVIRIKAIKNNVYKLAFSGGVFQNTLLIDMIIEYLSDEFELFFHNQLSPNDECVSFGQVAYHMISQNKDKASDEKQKKENVLN